MFSRISRLSKVAILAPLFFMGLFLADNWRTDTFIHPEMLIRMPFYGTSRGEGVLREMSKTFDACSNEGIAVPVSPCPMRYRQMGFFLDFLDAKMIIALNRIFAFPPRALSHFYFSFLAITLLGLSLSRMMPGSRWYYPWAFATFFGTTTPLLLHNGIYLRSSKIASAFTIALLFYLWVKYSKIPIAQFLKNVRGCLLMVALIVLVFLSLLTDEQAIFFGLMFFGLAILDGFVRRQASAVGFILLGSISLLGVYVLWVAKWAAMYFESILIDPGFSNPKNFFYINFKHFWSTCGTFLFELQRTFGCPGEGSPVYFALGFLVLLVGYFLSRNARKDYAGKSLKNFKETVFPRITPIYFGLSIFIMLYAFGTHSALVDGFGGPITRQGYYYMTFSLIMVISFLVFFANLGLLRSERFCNGLVLAMVLFSIGNYKWAERERTEFFVTKDAWAHPENRNLYRLETIGSLTVEQLPHEWFFQHVSPVNDIPRFCRFYAKEVGTGYLIAPESPHYLIFMNPQRQDQPVF